MQDNFDLNDLAVFEKPLIMYLAGYPSDCLPQKFATVCSLSKSQTLQLCLYYFSRPDSNNFLLNIPIKFLAKFIGFSLKTIKNNNKLLSDIEFISFTTYGNNYLSLKLHIKDQLEDYESILLRKNLLLRILEIESINSIRIIFRFILRLNESNNLYNGKVIFYSYNDIQRFLPINHKKIINNLVLETKSIFNIEFVTNGFYISYK